MAIDGQSQSHFYGNPIIFLRFWAQLWKKFFGSFQKFDKKIPKKLTIFERKFSKFFVKFSKKSKIYFKSWPQKRENIIGFPKK